MDTVNNIRPFKAQNGKWGYKDNDTILIEPIYNSAMPYYDGLYWVKYIGWGAVDINNNTIIPYLYKRVERIAPNRYRVLSFDGKYGVLDNKGDLIIESQYELIKCIGADILELKSGEDRKWVNYDGELLFDSLVEEKINSVFLEGDYVFIITESQQLITNRNGFTLSVGLSVFYYDSNDDYVVLGNNYSDTLIISVFSRKGEKVYEFDTKDIASFHLIKDSLLLELKSNGESTPMFTIINLNTKIEKSVNNICQAFMLGYDCVSKYFGVISLGEEGKWGVFDLDGACVIPLSYNGLGRFYNQTVDGCYFDGQYLAATKDGETCGIIDLFENVVIPFDYQSIEGSGMLQSGTLIVSKDARWGVINLKNEVIIELKYQHIDSFKNNRAIAKYNNRYGVIDAQGREVLSFIYDEIEGLENGGYLAEQGYYYCVFDAYGNELLHSCDLKIKTNLVNGEQILEVVQDYHWGYLDLYCNEILPCSFSKYCKKIFIDLVGRTSLPCTIEGLNYSVLKPELENVIEEYQGYIIGEENTIYYIINPKGEIIYIDSHSSLSFGGSDEESLFIEFGGQYHRDALCIDLSTQRLKVSVIDTNSETLQVLKSGDFYGVADKDGKLLLPIEFGYIEVEGNIVLARKADDGWLLHHAQRIITEVSSTYYGWPELVTVGSNFVFCPRSRFLYGDEVTGVIVSQDGNLIHENALSVEEYAHLYIVEVKAEPQEECDALFALFSKSFQPLYAGLLLYIEYSVSGIFIGRSETEHVLFDEKGNIVFATNQYERIAAFHEGLAIVVKDGKYGAIDTAGKEIIPCIHDEISDFANGVATTEKYGETVTFHKDGTMSKVHYGELRTTHKSNRTVYCHIDNNKLLFVNEVGENVNDIFSDDNNDLIIISYNAGKYVIHNEQTSGSVEGSLFIIDKTGAILTWRQSRAFSRLSPRCAIIGRESLLTLNTKNEALTDVAENADAQSLFISSNGILGDYLSSYNSNVHFVREGDNYLVINECCEVIWSTSHRMLLREKESNCFTLLTFYSKPLPNKNFDQTIMVVWDSKKRIPESRDISHFNFYDNSDRFVSSKDGKYLILPSIRNASSFSSRHNIHLLVLNEQNEITIDEDFDYAKLRSINNSHVLLENYNLKVIEEWNEFSDDSEYKECIEWDGYTLVSLDGQITARSHSPRFFIIESQIESDEGERCWRKGVYDYEKEMMIVPAVYNDCDFIETDNGFYVVTENGRIKLSV